MGRPRHTDRRRDVLGRPKERPVRCDERQSGDRPARPGHSWLAAGRIWPQEPRRLSHRPREWRGRDRRRRRRAGRNRAPRRSDRARRIRLQPGAASSAVAATTSTMRPGRAPALREGGHSVGTRCQPIGAVRTAGLTSRLSDRISRARPSASRGPPTRASAQRQPRRFDEYRYQRVPASPLTLRPPPRSRDLRPSRP